MPRLRLNKNEGTRLMPFAYYGAKHGLASKYPPPAYGVIVEPFAGSAGYSVHHAASVDRVVLVEADPAVVKLWHRVKSLTTDELERLSAECVAGERTVNPLLAATGGSSSLSSTLAGQSRQITPRMVRDWPLVRRRIERVIPHLHKFEIVADVYTAAPDIEATWHIDPPYQPLLLNRTRSLADQAGNAYRHGSNDINYQSLAEWCRTRRGLVMVCEQSPAAWLPFYPLARQTNGAGSGGATRTEMIWRNDAEQTSLWGTS